MYKMSNEMEKQIIILMKQIGFNQNETVTVLLLLDKYKDDKERELLLEKLQNNELTTKVDLEIFVRKLIY